MIRLGLCVLGKKTTEVKCHFPYTTAFYQYALSLLLLTLVDVVLLDYSTLNLFFFPAFHVAFLKPSHYVLITLQKIIVIYHLLGEEMSI